MDFRIIKPKRVFDDYRKKDCFLIPCNVLYIGDAITSNIRILTIERLDFKSGRIIQHKAITYEKTIKIFEDLNLSAPFITECKIIKDVYKKGLNFIVYGIYNTSGVLNELIDNYNFSNEMETIEYYKNIYIELNAWTQE